MQAVFALRNRLIIEGIQIEIETLCMKRFSNGYLPLLCGFFYVKLSNWSTFGVNTFSNTKYVYTVKPLLTTTPKIRPTRY